jgi:acyl carrier protein
MSWRRGQSRSSENGAIADRVCIVVARTLRIPPELRPLGVDTRLHGAGLGLDSVDALRLLAALEEEFDIMIEDDEITPDLFERIGSLVSLVARVSARR